MSFSAACKAQDLDWAFAAPFDFAQGRLSHALLQSFCTGYFYLLNVKNPLPRFTTLYICLDPEQPSRGLTCLKLPPAHLSAAHHRVTHEITRKRSAICVKWHQKTRIQMTRKVIPIALILAFAAAPLASAQDSPVSIYQATCAPCHGVNGDANTPAGKKYHATVFNTAAGLKESDSELLKIARKGKGQMPPWSDVLTDAQLKSVIEYIRTFQKK
jgi:cytochrome c5